VHRTERTRQQALTTAEFALGLGVGLGCGALIGVESQWRARMAGPPITQWSPRAPHGRVDPPPAHPPAVMRGGVPWP
jgi:hypothetical protein